MKRSRTAPHSTRKTKLIWPVLILVPILLTLAWGQHLSAEVYTLLSLARNMAAGAGLTPGSVGHFPAPVVQGPLFAFLVSIAVRFGLEPAWAALILSAAGWSVAAFALLATGQSLQRPRGGMVAALLLCFNPAIITTLGGPVAWLIALGWLTVALLLRRHLIASAVTFLLSAALLIPWPPGSSWPSVSYYGSAIAWSILLFAAGVGADWLAEQLVSRDLVRLSFSQMETSLLVTVFLLIGSWQGIRLWQLTQGRPEILWQLEAEVASWLHTEMGPAETLLANERIGHLARRPTASLPDLHQLETATGTLELLQAHPIDYLVTTNDLPWQQLRESVWFRLAYEPLKQFNSPYLPQAPITAWAYRMPVDELGQRHAINARVPDRLWLLGYQIGPEQVRAGESVQMALTMQAPQATVQSHTTFKAIVRLLSQVDNSTIEEWRIDLPQSISPENWQAGEVIVEQFPLAMPEDLEAGVYLLNLSLLGPESENLWPISLDNDFNQLDRVPTGYIIVPWEEDPENIEAIEAGFGAAIQLVGFAASEKVADGVLDVTLQWQTQHAMEEDYVVFVHLVDSSGQLVANHDGIPGNGRFPTRAWQPGVTIPDTHSISLPPDLPAGEYKLKVGLYAPDTGQRLAATAADGTAPEDKSILLKEISRP